MAVKYNVTITWMEHSGGTKFYQVFKFSRIGKSSVAPQLVYLNHWGPMNMAKGRFSRPVNGGQTQIKVGAIENPVEAKVKRGYRMIDTATREVKPYDPWFKEAFGSAVADNLHIQLFGSAIGDSPVPSNELDNEEIAAPPSVTVPEERPESWGSW